MTYEEQKKMHIDHLRAQGFDIQDITIGSEKYISCSHIGSKSPKRIACYKTFLNEKPEGGISLFTNYKTATEEWKKFVTNGQQFTPKPKLKALSVDEFLNLTPQDDTEFDF